jgi:hypothetical protein
MRFDRHPSRRNAAQSLKLNRFLAVLGVGFAGAVA